MPPSMKATKFTLHHPHLFLHRDKQNPHPPPINKIKLKNIFLVPSPEKDFVSVPPPPFPKTKTFPHMEVLKKTHPHHPYHSNKIRQTTFLATPQKKTYLFLFFHYHMKTKTNLLPPPSPPPPQWRFKKPHPNHPYHPPGPTLLYSPYVLLFIYYIYMSLLSDV